MRRAIYLLLLALVIIPAQVLADTIPATTIVSTSSISSATTTQVLAAQASQTLIYWMGAAANSTNASNTISFEYSTVAACASSATKFFPQPVAMGTSAGLYTAVLGGVSAGVASGPSLSPIPFVLPAGNYVCIVTAGTTTALYGILVYGSQ